MNLLIGIILLLSGGGIVAVARPNSGGQYTMPLMHMWAVGQLYVLTALVLVVVGVSFCLMAWLA